ncbi:MAG: 30S ribosomal protein S5 [Candidatus Pacebacteria bacterium]|nr:30S ribosomal protein S5 [Candidatus Paceibacterota bacterium]
MVEEKEIKKEDKKEEAINVVADSNKEVENKKDVKDSSVEEKKSFPSRAPFKKNFNSRKRKKFTKPRSEFDQKIIKIRRVTRVMSGGRRFSFSVAIVLGNKNGKVGVGVAKANDTALAIEKAAKKAKKNMIELKLTKNNSIPYDVSKKYCASVIQILPTKEGSGLSVGSSLKTVLELAGITDVTAKIISRGKNQLNIAKATIEALRDFEVQK